MSDTTPRKPKRKGTGEALGGILVGLDQQIFRNLPPPHELVLKATPVRGLSGEGGDLEITFPEDQPGEAGEGDVSPPLRSLGSLETKPEPEP
jgi:hypothetical protein